MTEIKYPKGFKSAPGYTKFAVNFPDDLFKAVMKMARLEKKPFNTMVLDLIRCGKLDLEESDKHEPKVTDEMQHGFGWKQLPTE